MPSISNGHVKELILTVLNRKTSLYLGTQRNRVFKVEDDIPKVELKKCITAALTYHKVKHLPSLGI